MKPMLAAKAPETLTFPLYASAKIDGVRAIAKDGMLLSRTLKNIPNKFVQETLAQHLRGTLDGLDGELTVGPPNAKNVMQATTSGVMSHTGSPDFTWWVFDYWTEPTVPFFKRWLYLHQRNLDAHPRVRLLPQVLVENADELARFEREQVDAGFEGIMVRRVDGPYKYGRATAREGTLLKVKRFSDAEAEVIGFEERMHNANEATKDELGRTKRSTHQANLVPTGTLGALIVRDVKTGIEFNVGTGFDDALRQSIWSSRDQYLGALVTYKHFELAGVKAAPRFPVFKAFRDRRDV